MSEITENKVVMIILSIILPPVAVFLLRGVGTELIISIVLTLLGGIPGMIYALWLTLK